MKKLLQWKRNIKGEKERRRNSSVSENIGYIIDLKRNDDNLTKLHQACWTGDVEKVKKHLKKCDINIQDNENRTPIHLAAAKGHKNILMILLENNAKVNIQDSQGRTPLMKVVECGHIDLVAMLLGSGADINIPDYNGDTALHISVDKEQNAITMILLQNKAELDSKNDDGKTPLHFACSKKQLDIVKVLLLRGANINETDKKLQTPLILACNSNSAPMISLLLENGANYLLTDFSGQSALDYAYATGNSEISEIFNQYKVEEIPKTEIPEVVTEQNLQKEENVNDSWNDSDDISTKNLDNPSKDDDSKEFARQTTELDNSEKNIEDEILSISQLNEVEKKGDIYSSPQKSTTLELPQSNPLKRKDDDLFADLSFSDSTTSDNENFSEKRNTKFEESNNEKASTSSVFKEENKTENLIPISPDNKINKENCDNFDNSDDDLNFEPYIPSVIDRKYSVDENHFKRPPLSRRTVSLDIASPVKYSFTNDIDSSSFQKNSENAKGSNNENIKEYDNFSPKTDANHLIPINTKNSSESEWDSEDSFDSYRNEELKKSENIDCFSNHIENKILSNLEASKELPSENSFESDPDIQMDEKGPVMGKSNSLKSENISISSEKSKSITSAQTDHWSTLGRFGTMQGRDEIWENNAKIRKNSVETGETTDKINKLDIINDESDTHEANSIDLNETEKGKSIESNASIDDKEVKIDVDELNDLENEKNIKTEFSIEQIKQNEKPVDLNESEEEKSILLSHNSKISETESENDLITNLENEIEIIETNKSVPEQSQLELSSLQNNEEENSNNSDEIFNILLIPEKIQENKNFSSDKFEKNSMKNDEKMDSEKSKSDIVKLDREVKSLTPELDKQKNEMFDIDDDDFIITETDKSFDVAEPEIELNDNIKRKISGTEIKLSTNFNESIHSKNLNKLENDTENNESNFIDSNTNENKVNNKSESSYDLKDKLNPDIFIEDNQNKTLNEEITRNDNEIQLSDLMDIKSDKIKSYNSTKMSMEHFNKTVKAYESNEREDVKLSSFEHNINSDINNIINMDDDNSFNKYINHEITSRTTSYLNFLETQNPITATNDYLEQISKNLPSKLTFRRLSVDQIINGALDPPQTKCIRRRSFNEITNLKSSFHNNITNIPKQLLRQNHYEDDVLSEDEKIMKESNKNDDKLSQDSISDHSECFNYTPNLKKRNERKRINLYGLNQESKQIQNDKRFDNSFNENEDFLSQKNNYQPSFGNLLTSNSWESWYSGTNHRQMRRLSMSVINSKSTDFLEQIPEKPEHRRLSLCLHKSTFEGTIRHEIHSLDKLEKSNCISNEINKDVNRKQFRIALTRSLSLNTVLNDENKYSNDKSNQISHKVSNDSSKYKNTNMKENWSTSLSDTVFEENQNEYLEKDKLKNTLKKSQKISKIFDENSTPHIILTSWEDEEKFQPEEMNKVLYESSSSVKNKIAQPAETSKKKEYLLPEGGSIEEDSSTTITDTEEDKKKINEAHPDLNEERDDTLSISTDEDLFLEEVCEKNESLHQHSISPSQLASLQGSLREHRLNVNKKSQKIKFLKNQLKTINHEKMQLQEKIEKINSSNSVLKNNILEMKNQLTNLQYSLEEEKQARRNTEILLNTMKEQLSHKDELFVKENSNRKSLENELRTIQEERKLMETNIQLLKMENNKLNIQLEQEKLLLRDQKRAKSETSEKSINTEMEQRLEQQQKQEQECILRKENNELKLENEELKIKIKKLEDDLNNKVSELSEKLELVQDKKNQIENQLQILDKELQKKQYELEKSAEMHSLFLKRIESEKDELQKEAKSELDKRLILENKAIETFQEINKLNADCQKYKQMIEALKISSVKESENCEALEKLKIENHDLKRELNDIKKLHEYTENITTQEKEVVKNTLSSVNDELQKTKIQLDDKTVKVLELQKIIREKEQSSFEKDLKFNELEKENSYLNQKIDKLQQRLIAHQTELNFLKLKTEDNGNNSEELCVKIESLYKHIESIKMEKFQLEEELKKQKDYSNMLNSKLESLKQKEDNTHQHIYKLKAEQNILKEKLAKENEHSSSLHQQLNHSNEKEEILNERIDTLKKQTRQLEDELNKEREHSSMLDNKLETFTQNLKKMELLVKNLQAAKEELESKINVESSSNNNLVKKELICPSHSSSDCNSVFQLTEKLKVIEHEKEKTEILLQKERQKSYKIMKLKQTSDIHLEQEKFRIHQLMDIITKLKTELDVSNNKIKRLDNFSHDLEQRYQREEWRIKIDDLNKQIEQLQKEMQIERNLRQEEESKCALLETELNSLRTIQTTLIEELLNELKTVKSQNKEKQMETNFVESGYKTLENTKQEEMYHILRDISIQLKKQQQPSPETNKLPEKNDFIKTKNKLMEELSQLQSSIISKGQEYDILEQERELLQRKYQAQNRKSPVQDMETPIKLSIENKGSSVSFTNYLPNRRWSSAFPWSNTLIDRKSTSDIHLQQSNDIPIRNSLSVTHTQSNLQFFKKDHANSSKFLPEFQIKLDNAITRHLNSGPKIDISVPLRHKQEENSAKDYLSALKQKYFV